MPSDPTQTTADEAYYDHMQKVVDNMNKDQSKTTRSGLYEDAWGVACCVPVQCEECKGSGIDYGETCLRCGGRGDHCERDESND